MNMYLQKSLLNLLSIVQGGKILTIYNNNIEIIGVQRPLLLNWNSVVNRLCCALLVYTWVNS